VPAGAVAPAVGVTFTRLRLALRVAKAIKFASEFVFACAKEK
jgi:hypothetical protein